MAYRSEDESDYSEEEEPEEIKKREEEEQALLEEQKRDEDYERLEIAMSNWPPPPCLGFMEEMSVVDIREAIISSKKLLLENVLDNFSIHSWNLYHRYFPKQNIFCPRAQFQYEDWETMGEYIMFLSEKCTRDFSWYTVLRILRFGKFVKIVPRPYLPKRN